MLLILCLTFYDRFFNWSVSLWCHLGIKEILVNVSHGEHSKVFIEKFKREPEHSLHWIDFGVKSSLFFVRVCPFVTITSPWSKVVVFWSTPWVSNLDKFRSLGSVFVCKLHSFKNGKAVVWNQVIIWGFISCCTSHWPVVICSFHDDFPKIVIAFLFKLCCLPRRSWHSSEKIESYSWLSTIESIIVSKKFCTSFFKKDCPPCTRRRSFGSK